MGMRAYKWTWGGWLESPAPVMLLKILHLTLLAGQLLLRVLKLLLHRLLVLLAESLASRLCKSHSLASVALLDASHTRWRTS